MEHQGHQQKSKIGWFYYMWFQVLETDSLENATFGVEVFQVPQDQHHPIGLQSPAEPNVGYTCRSWHQIIDLRFWGMFYSELRRWHLFLALFGWVWTIQQFSIASHSSCHITFSMFCRISIKRVHVPWNYLISLIGFCAIRIMGNWIHKGSNWCLRKWIGATGC